MRLFAVVAAGLLFAAPAAADADPFVDAVARIPGFADMSPQKVDWAADMVCRLLEQQLDVESVSDAVRLGGVASGILHGTPNRVSADDADKFVAAAIQYRCLLGKQP